MFSYDGKITPLVLVSALSTSTEGSDAELFFIKCLNKSARSPQKRNEKAQFDKALKAILVKHFTEWSMQYLSENGIEFCSTESFDIEIPYEHILPFLIYAKQKIQANEIDLSRLEELREDGKNTRELEFSDLSLSLSEHCDTFADFSLEEKSSKFDDSNF